MIDTMTIDVMVEIHVEIFVVDLIEEVEEEEEMEEEEITIIVIAVMVIILTTTITIIKESVDGQEIKKKRGNIYESYEKRVVALCREQS